MDNFANFAGTTATSSQTSQLDSLQLLDDMIEEVRNWTENRGTALTPIPCWLIASDAEEKYAVLRLAHDPEATLVMTDDVKSKPVVVYKLSSAQLSSFVIEEEEKTLRGEPAYSQALKFFEKYMKSRSPSLAPSSSMFHYLHKTIQALSYVDSYNTLRTRWIQENRPPLQVLKQEMRGTVLWHLSPQYVPSDDVEEILRKAYFFSSRLRRADRYDGSNGGTNLATILIELKFCGIEASKKQHIWVAHNKIMVRIKESEFTIGITNINPIIWDVNQQPLGVVQPPGVVGAKRELAIDEDNESFKFAYVPIDEDMLFEEAEREVFTQEEKKKTCYFCSSVKNQTRRFWTLESPFSLSRNDGMLPLTVTEVFSI